MVGHGAGDREWRPDEAQRATLWVRRGLLFLTGNCFPRKRGALRRSYRQTGDADCISNDIKCKKDAAKNKYLLDRLHVRG